MEYKNENRGVLFRNEKRTNEKAPEYEGRIDINGKEYRLAAWIKESKAGKKFFSLAVTSPAIPAKKEEKPIQPLETTMMDDIDELPF